MAALSHFWHLCGHLGHFWLLDSRVALAWTLIRLHRVDEAREILLANLELAVELEDRSTETLAREQGVPDERAAELLAEGRSLRVEAGRDLGRGVARIG